MLLTKEERCGAHCGIVATMRACGCGKSTFAKKISSATISAPSRRFCPQLGGWQPNYSCNERERERRRLAFAHGTQAELAFEEAVIIHDRNGFAALEIHLRSSARLLIVELRWEEGKSIVTTLLDCPCERDGRPRH